MIVGQHDTDCFHYALLLPVGSTRKVLQTVANSAVQGRTAPCLLTNLAQEIIIAFLSLYYPEAGMQYNSTVALCVLTNDALTLR